MTSDNIPFISTFNPNNINALPLVYNYRPILELGDKTKEVFKGIKFINSKKQAPNLKRLLTKAAYTSTQSPTLGVTKCKNIRCKCCHNIYEGNTFYFENKNIHFQIKTEMNCSTKNVIYVLVCCGCKKIYIGETKTDLRTRVRLHRSNIINNVGLYVSQHIFECTSQLDLKFKIMPIYKMGTEDTLSRKLKEKQFIDKFQPELNR